MPKKMTPRKDAAAQSVRFIEGAREIGQDEFPDALEAAGKKPARHNPAQPLDMAPEKLESRTTNKAEWLL